MAGESKKGMTIEIHESEQYIIVKLGPQGQLGVSSNSPSQITQLGMLSMATGLLQKPKESQIVKPGTIDRLLHKK